MTHGLADFHFRALSSQLSSIVFNSNLRKMADNQRIRDEDICRHYCRVSFQANNTSLLGPNSR